VYGPVLWRALKVAAVVGTVLFVINQLDVVLSGQVTPLVVFKIGLTYLVPFSVSSYSALEANRLR
jgi:Mg/Co/Ni transporter MgtE